MHNLPLNANVRHQRVCVSLVKTVKRRNGVRLRYCIHMKKRGQARVIALMYAPSLSRNLSELLALVSIFPICRLNVEDSR